MTEIIFSFDTEDFTSNKAMDCILEEATLLSEEGVRGCFCVVGLVAKQLQEWGRYDVVKALSEHELDFHTYSHSVRPIIDVMTDIDDAKLAEAMVISHEKSGLDCLAKTFGDSNVTAVSPPGNEASYAAMYAYTDLEIPIYAGTCCDTEEQSGAYYCNMYHMAYTESLELTLFEAEEKDLLALLDRIACKKHAILYTHPNMSRFTEFWDAKNYRDKNPHTFGVWEACAERDEAATQKFYHNFKMLLRLIKNDKRFRLTTYREIYQRELSRGERVVKRTDLPQIRDSIMRRLYPLNTPCSLSISDIFCACRAFLNGEEEYRCGKVYGFLKMPYAISEEVTLFAEDIRASAEHIDTTSYLPTKISVGDNIIGAADWLRAALAVLCGENSVTLVPGETMPSLDALPGVRDCTLKGTWLHPAEFKDRFLSDRLRLQAWTMRF